MRYIPERQHWNNVWLAAGIGFLLGWLLTTIYPGWPIACLLLGIVAAFGLILVGPLLVIALSGGRR